MPLRDILLAITVMALWGMHYVVIRVGALEIPPFMLLSIRFMLCGLVFFPFASRINWGQFKNLVLYSLPFQGMHMGLLFAGLAQVDAGLAGLIMKAGVPFSIILAWVFYKERFGLKTLTGLVIAFGGGFFMLHAPAEGANVTMIGVFILIGSAFFWALGSVRLKYIKELNFPTMAAYAFAIPIPFAIIASLIFEQGQIEAFKTADHIILAGVLFYQVILMSMSHYWWKVLIGRNEVYKVTPFSLLTPVFGVVFGMLILGEHFSLNMAIGAVVALTGIAIVTFRKQKRQEGI